MGVVLCYRGSSEKRRPHYFTGSVLSILRPRTPLHVIIVVVRVLAVVSLETNALLSGLDLTIGKLRLRVVRPMGPGISPCLCLAGVLGWASIVIILKCLALLVSTPNDGIVILGALVNSIPSMKSFFH